MTKFLQYSIYPIIVFGTLWLSFFLVERVPESYLLFIPILILLPVLVLIVMLEKFIPYKKIWNKNLNDLNTDLLQTFVTLPSVTQFSLFLWPFILYFPLKWMSISKFNFGRFN